MKKWIVKWVMAVCSALAFLTTHLQAVAISAEEKQILTEIRSGVFGGSRLAAAFQQTTISGAEPPIFPLEVEQRGLIVWEIHEKYAESFAQEIGLAPPFQLASVYPITVKGDQALAAIFRESAEQRGLTRILDILYPKRFYVIADIGNTSRAEDGAKLEFKTFVALPGDSTPRLYRFSSFKAQPGVELLQLSTSIPSSLTVEHDAGIWSGSLYTAEGSLEWNAKYRQRGALRSRLSEAFLDASELQFAPAGAAAKYFYDGSSVSGGVSLANTRRTFVGNTFSWSKYLKTGASALVTDTKAEFLVQPVTAPITVTSGGPGACGAPALNSSQLFSNLVGCVLAGVEPSLVFAQLFQSVGALPPQEIPTLYFGLLDLYQGLSILQGQERPKLFFSLRANPQTIFINFEIAPQKVKAFEEEFLPDGFELARMRFYPEQLKPVYAVSLNVYESVGQNISGYRAEWSTYVINPSEEDPKPRFSVLEAQTNIGGFDAVGALERYTPGLDLSTPEGLQQLIEPPSDLFTYSADLESGIQVEVLDLEEGIEVEVSIDTPPVSELLRTAPTTTWMEANDFVYWGEVADILKYDSKVMFAELLVFEVASQDVIRDTTFEGYVSENPLPIIIWNGPQEIALEPWGNLEDIAVQE
ncbi:hypothetical protein [Microbulbifer mangrovi]|uniref:hypothetical protein n=1 Tax=Microbulbifer mangrovi TaxID=927787 RepID=UPI0009907513|nr:hypothetical protein [Microbulbifer mangrovi]